MLITTFLRDGVDLVDPLSSKPLWVTLGCFEGCTWPNEKVKSLIVSTKLKCSDNIQSINLLMAYGWDTPTSIRPTGITHNWRSIAHDIVTVDQFSRAGVFIIPSITNHKSEYVSGSPKRINGFATSDTDHVTSIDFQQTHSNLRPRSHIRNFSHRTTKYL